MLDEWPLTCAACMLPVPLQRLDGEVGQGGLVVAVPPGALLGRLVHDRLFSEELNGQAIKTVRCRTEPANNEKGESGYPVREPVLEGVKINGRWVVIYSKYDIGCALENHKSSECLGHDHESALRLGSAVVMYALIH